MAEVCALLVCIVILGLVCWSLTSLCHSNGHIETMPAREINPFTALTRIRSRVSQDTMIDEQSSASEHDYASDRSAIGLAIVILGKGSSSRFRFVS